MREASESRTVTIQIPTLFVYKQSNANEGMTAAQYTTMDSIILQETTDGHYGEQCQVEVSTGDIYTGIYHGYCEATPDNPLSLKLKISTSEATRIGVPHFSEIGIPYDVIKSIRFF